MKNKPLLLLVALILALTFSGCGETLPAPQDTPVPTRAAPTAEPTAGEAPAAQPPATDTLPAVETQPPSVLADTPLPTLAPTFTLAATFTQAAATAGETAAATQTPPSALGPLPQEGQWGGGAGSTFILSFVIGRESGQATIGELGLLWFGPDDCALNLRIPDITVIQGPQFTRFFNGSEYSYNLSGRIVSETVMEGTIKIDVEDCGAPTFNWRAIPKPAP